MPPHLRHNAGDSEVKEVQPDVSMTDDEMDGGDAERVSLGSSLHHLNFKEFRYLREQESKKGKTFFSTFVKTIGLSKNRHKRNGCKKFFRMGRDPKKRGGRS